MTDITFEPFPKIGRLTRECVITEKIDGTNAQVNIVPKCSCAEQDGDMACGNCPTKEFIVAGNATHWMFAGSRTRYITPFADNMGFAAWVKANADDLFNLGPGRHFGEWWGGKIQRGYGLTEKRFSLFNTSRWADRWMYRGVNYVNDGYKHLAPKCCRVVPELYRGLFSDRIVDNMVEKLRHEGSVAAPGFLRPEGVVAFHTATGVLFKKTLDNDAQPKGHTAA